ncbi:MAG: hypothetical protein V3U79_01135 [Dehalococcoidia bacterium]
MRNKPDLADVNVLEANVVISALIKQAISIGPKDPFTISAIAVQVMLSVMLFPTIILIPPSTFLLGIGVNISFGLLLLAFSIIWMPMLGMLMGTSWLWLKVPILRPVLLLPGLAVATLARVYVSLIPDMGEHYQKVLKMGFCDSWPHSLTLYRLSSKVEKAYAE